MKGEFDPVPLSLSQRRRNIMKPLRYSIAFHESHADYMADLRCDTLAENEASRLQRTLRAHIRKPRTEIQSHQNPIDSYQLKITKIYVEPDAAPNGSPGGLLKSAVIIPPAQSRMLLRQPPRLRLDPFCSHLPVPESRG